MIELDIQRAFEAANGNSMLPADAELKSWVNGALKKYQKPFELTIRIVGIDESQALNHQYRNKDKPTNVLSFPFEIPEGVDLNLLGDIVVCAPVVEQEAKEQNKMRTAHWAHMIVHGCLHLLGYDHISDSEAEEMESLEIDILAELGFNNPYEEI